MRKASSRRFAHGVDQTSMFQLSSSDSAALAQLHRRLAVVRDRVRGVAFRHYPGFYLFGRPGTSKTFTVCGTLQELGVAYHYSNGHMTPMGLFEVLAQYHDRIIVLDDIGHLLTQPPSLQLILAAMGNQSKNATARLVPYKRQGKVSVVTFTGGIICMSNLELRRTPLLEALKSRLQYLQHDPTEDQMAALMRAIASKGWPEACPKLAPRECFDVTEHLISESKRLECRLDIRHLVDKAFPDFLQHRDGQTETDWRDLVTCTLQEAAFELKHTPAAPKGRAEKLEAQYIIVRAIVAEHHDPKQRLAVWKERTRGKSDRAFYRRCQELGIGR